MCPGELLHILRTSNAALDDFGVPRNNRERRLKLVRYVAREATAHRHLRIKALTLLVEAVDLGNELFGNVCAVRMIEVDRGKLGGDFARYNPSHKKRYANRSKKHYKIGNQHGRHNAPHTRMCFLQT